MMLALALAGLLAASAPETLPRVPGMRFRLGMEESAMLALGTFPEARVPDAGTMTARVGTARFFGVPGEATCYIQDGRLAWIKFEATGVSSHSQDYVDGQLRRMQYARGCQRDDRSGRECDWTGPALRVHTVMKKDALTARVEPWPPPEPPAGDSPVAAAAPHQAAAPTGSASPSTPPQATPAGTAATASPSAPAARKTAAPAPATPPKPADPPARPPAAVVTLPETLVISLASRNAPDVWPRIVSAPTLTYPEAARRESVQGVVWVMALVGPAGEVIDAWIDRGLPELETAALAWVSRSKFAPCERGGAPCRFHVRVAVLFSLH